MYKASSFMLLAVFAIASSASAGDSGRESRSPRALEREGRVVPQVSVVVDGVRYAPGEVARLRGQRLFYVVDREAVDQGFVWAFTTAAGADEHLAAGEAAEPQLEKTCPIARFNKVAYGTGIDWLTMYCGQTTSYVGSNWNNTISYVEGGGSYTILYSIDSFQGDTFTVAGGVTVQDLHPYGFNNRTSSIKVCPEGTSYTDCLLY